jgi:8-oxo-dGTP pyrophosphatase MutT (NUDIX family)
MLNNRKESKTFINLGVVLNNKGEVLIIRRKVIEKGVDGSSLQWAFPGGKQCLNENREECVKREVLAETGYDIEPSKQISLRVHPQFPVTIVYHLCVLKFKEPIAKPIEPHEIAEIKWVKSEEIKELFTTDIDPKVANELGI